MLASGRSLINQTSWRSWATFFVDQLTNYGQSEVEFFFWPNFSKNEQSRPIFLKYGHID